MRLLEMSEGEVEQAVEKELADNPALSVKQESPATELTEDGSVFSESSEDLQRKDFANAEESPWYRERGIGDYSAERYVPQTPAEGESLYESLLRQLGETSLDSRTRSVAEYIAGNLDGNGYLQRTPAGILTDIAVRGEEEISPELLERALEAIRSLDPPGVGAVDLPDSLRLQLLRRPQGRTEKDALRIIENAWPLFLKLHTPRIAAKLHFSAERTARAMALLTSLNPKPGGVVGSGPSQEAPAVTPDFIVDADDAGNISISLGGRQREFQIEQSFESAMKLMQARGEKKKIRGADYISARYGDARSFIALMQQRRDTLMAIITAIVSLQKEYFLTDDDARLRPMTQKDVAALAGYDHSTVSRATSGKYLQTRAGILPMRHLFSEGYGSGEDEVSARQVESALASLVKGEDPSHPLTDDALRTALAAKGLEVSRRTVAKYRDRLGIPVARLRRRH